MYHVLGLLHRRISALAGREKVQIRMERLSLSNSDVLISRIWAIEKTGFNILRCFLCCSPKVDNKPSPKRSLLDLARIQSKLIDTKLEKCFHYIQGEGLGFFIYILIFDENVMEGLGVENDQLTFLLRFIEDELSCLRMWRRTPSSPLTIMTLPSAETLRLNKPKEKKA